MGYARVSTEDQHLHPQLAAHRSSRRQRTFGEKISGSKAARPELERLINQLRRGKVVVVTKYDRLSRSPQDHLTIVETIRTRGAGFSARWKILNLVGSDTL